MTKNNKGFKVSDKGNKSKSPNLRGLKNLKKNVKSKKEAEDIPEEYDEQKEDKKEHEKKEEDQELKNIRKEFDKLKKKAEQPRFPRIESKPEFASEVVNVPSNQKVANLEDEQITDLLNKRRFMNMCNEYGWGVVAKMAGLTIADIENYSLSKKGFLVDNVLNERQKQTLEQYSNSNKKGKKEADK